MDRHKATTSETMHELHVSGDGTAKITICGMRKLYGTEHTVVPDRIEVTAKHAACEFLSVSALLLQPLQAGTLLFAAAISNSHLTVVNVLPSHMRTIVNLLHDIGCKVERQGDSVLHLNPPADGKLTTWSH